MVAGFGQLGASFAPNIYVIYLCNVGFVGNYYLLQSQNNILFLSNKLYVLILICVNM